MMDIELIQSGFVPNASRVVFTAALRSDACTPKNTSGSLDYPKNITSSSVLAPFPQRGLYLSGRCSGYNSAFVA